jgi:hypothetical protein
MLDINTYKTEEPNYKTNHDYSQEKRHKFISNHNNIEKTGNKIRENETLSDNWHDPWERMFTSRKSNANDSISNINSNKNMKKSSPVYSSSESESSSKSFSRSRSSSSSSSKSSRSSSENTKSSEDNNATTRLNYRNKLKLKKGNKKI